MFTKKISTENEADSLNESQHGKMGKSSKFKNIISQSSSDNLYHWNDTSENIIFDFNVDHLAPLLIYSSDGGGLESLEILKILRINSSLAIEISNAIEILGDNFYSIMIRNTDYRTDYKKYFEVIKGEIGKDSILVITSDDRACIDYAANLFECPTFSFSCPPAKNNGKALIYGQHGRQLQNLYNFIALKELFICSSANKFFLTNISGYKDQIWDGERISGFVNLCNQLFLHSEIRQSVLGRNN
jgi:hypothetical protein